MKGWQKALCSDLRRLSCYLKVNLHAPGVDAPPHMKVWQAHLALRSASAVAKHVPLAHSNPELMPPIGGGTFIV